MVLDVGYAVDHGLTEDLKRALGATLTEAHLQTLVKGAIVGPSSGLNIGGTALSFTLASGDDPSTQTWQLFHPLALVQRINDKLRSHNDKDMGQDGNARPIGLRIGKSGNPLIDLLEGLIDKVSSITMIDKDEVEPDIPLKAYSLDSLVSVELRNWIRRETGVELPLPRIVGSENLRALATHILSQREVKK